MEKIDMLEGGAFQCLCNAFITCSRESNINTLGSQLGSLKTVKGTPDAYYYDTNDGKYVFIEYTTQKSNLDKKIKEDLDKCYEVIKSSEGKFQVKKIIYFHTSNRLEVSIHSSLITYAKDKGFDLELISIDYLAREIYLKYQNLAKEYLDMSVDTGQIKSIELYIQDNNQNKFSTPLDTKFLSRDSELRTMNDSYDKKHIVILSGISGIGKTKLAMEYAKDFCHKNPNFEGICIKGNQRDIWEDLNFFIGNKEYFIVIDDANELNKLECIIATIIHKLSIDRVRFLVTVRDYALSSVYKTLNQFAECDVITLPKFNDSEIIQLINQNLDIKNKAIQRRILDIAEGNPRVALYAGKLVLENISLECINDLTKVYESYFLPILDNENLLNKKIHRVVLALIAAFGKVDLRYLDYLDKILNKCGFTINEFIETVKELHDKEVLIVLHNNICSVSDQCLHNYLLKYFIIDSSELDWVDIFKVIFEYNDRALIDLVNILLNIYRTEGVYEKLKAIIMSIWDDFEQNNNPLFNSFFCAFYCFKPIDSLILIGKMIDEIPESTVKLDDIDRETRRNEISINDNYLTMLGELSYSDEYNSSIELFIKYLLKKPDHYIDFYHAANKYFSLDGEYIEARIERTVHFINSLFVYSDSWKNKILTTFYLDLCKTYLLSSVSYSLLERSNTVVNYRGALNLTDSIKRYRTIIWENLFNISKNDMYKDLVRDLLFLYTISLDYSIEVINFDFRQIVRILNENYKENNIINAFLYQHLNDIFKKINNKDLITNIEYWNNDKFNIYLKISGEKRQDIIDYEKWQELQAKLIVKFASGCSYNDIYDVINTVDNCKDIKYYNKSHLVFGLNLFFQNIDSTLILDAIELYISMNTPLFINPHNILKRLFKLFNSDDIYKIITKLEYDDKNYWLYAFFFELPESAIKKDHIKQLYAYFEDKSDKDLKSSPLRDLEFLLKYKKYDTDIFINVCLIILEKESYSIYLVELYLSYLFNEFSFCVEALSERFSNHYQILEKVFFVLLKSKSFDFDSNFLKFLFEKNNEILKRYLDFTIANNLNIDNKVDFIYDFTLYENYLDLVYDCIFSLDRIKLIKANSFIKHLLVKESILESVNKQNKWFISFINRHYEDCEHIKFLWHIIAGKSNNKKLEYTLLLLSLNKSLDLFKALPWRPIISEIYTSEIVLIDNDLSFFRDLQSHLVGTDFLLHKQYIDSLIKKLEKSKIDVKVRELKSAW